MRRQNATRINPSNYDAWCLKGYSLNDLEQFDDALSCFTEAWNINPEKPLANYAIGCYMYYDNRFEEALDYFDKVLEIVPNDLDSLYKKAFICFKSESWHESLKSSIEFLKSNQNNVEMLYEGNFIVQSE